MPKFEHLPGGLKFSIDAVSLSALAATLVNILPSVATLLTITWTGIRIYETATVQRLVQRLLNRKDRTDG